MNDTESFRQSKFHNSKSDVSFSDFQLTKTCQVAKFRAILQLCFVGF